MEGGGRGGRGAIGGGGVPRISRSGTTVLACLALGLRAARRQFGFRFWWGSPPCWRRADSRSSGALIHPPPGRPRNWSAVGLGFVVSAVVSFIVVVRWLLGYVRNRPFAAFGWYRIALALVIFALVRVGRGVQAQLSLWIRAPPATRSRTSLNTPPPAPPKAVGAYRDSMTASRQKAHLPFSILRMMRMAPSSGGIGSVPPLGCSGLDIAPMGLSSRRQSPVWDCGRISGLSSRFPQSGLDGRRHGYGWIQRYRSGPSPLIRHPEAHGSMRNVVILMQENRSFDHCCGELPRRPGFRDPRAVTLLRQPGRLNQIRAGETYAPFRLSSRDTRRRG